MLAMDLRRPEIGASVSERRGPSVVAMKKAIVRRLGRLVNFERSRRIGRAEFVTPVLGGVAVPCEGEGWMLPLLERLVPRFPGTFVDVGVNLGQTLLKLRAVDPSRAYVGFEPNPACVVYVAALVRANDLRSCTVVPCGIFSEDGIVMLDRFSAREHDAAASVVVNHRPGERVIARVPVVVARWATIVRAIGVERIGVVKVDVEGAEAEVLEEMAPVLERDRPAVLVEVLPAYRADNHARLGRQRRVEAVLQKAAYQLYRVAKDGPDRVGLEPLVEIGVHGDLARCDYLALPRERAELAAQLAQRSGQSR